MIADQPLRSPYHDALFAGGMLILLCLLAAALSVGALRETPDVRVTVEAGAGTDGAGGSVSDDQAALFVTGGGDAGFAATLNFTLPPDASPSRWVVWFHRSPVNSLQLSRDAWASPTLGFYQPQPEEGLLPAGYAFRLPADAAGEMSLEMQGSGAIRSLLRPQVLREDAVLLIAQRGAAVAAALYSGLFVLALLALSLFSAARDRTFLAFFGYCVLALMLLATVNGHLYQLPGFRLFAGWRSQGTWAVLLLYTVASLQTLQRYAGTSITMPRLVRAIDRFCLGLVALATLCLLGLPGVGAWMQPLATLAWVSGELLALLLLVEAGRRSVPMAWPIALLTALSATASFGAELAVRGNWESVLWIRYGYQSLVLVTAATLGVGLVSRIGEYRDQRDRERQARAESERRMRRDAARNELGNVLQARLRTLAPGDIEWSAFRMMLEALLPQVPAECAAVIAYGYHGHDMLVVEPLASKQLVHDSLGRRGRVLKRLAALGMPLQQPGTSARSATDSMVMEAVIPMGIRSPGWGVLLLERPGADGFTSEELALAGEFMRLTVMHADQALAAINLRQSAELDALTGTFNRRTIDQWLARSFSDAAHRGEPLSVLFVDLDHFKAINDRLGHGCGDHCLRELAMALRKALPEGSLLARYGGEEFIAVLPGLGAAVAREQGEVLRAAVEHLSLEWQGEPVRLTVSIGVATRLSSEATPSATIERADKALYAAKRQGRNCVQVAPAVFA